MTHMFVTDVKFVVVNPIFKKQLDSKVVKPWALVRWSVTVVKAEHPENAVADIIVRVLGIIIWLNVIQFRNALTPILVTVVGISGTTPTTLTVELKPVIDVLVVELSKTKKKFETDLFKTAVEIPELINWSVL